MVREKSLNNDKCNKLIFAFPDFTLIFYKKVSSTNRIVNFADFLRNFIRIEKQIRFNKEKALKRPNQSYKYEKMPAHNRDIVDEKSCCS
jgi:hypothetical protein